MVVRLENWHWWLEVHVSLIQGHNPTILLTNRFVRKSLILMNSWNKNTWMVVHLENGMGWYCSQVASLRSMKRIG